MNPSISFTEQDLTLFSASSGDRNPLHLSAAYARGTAYGQPLIFGCLGAIACLSQIVLPEGSEIRWLQAEFLRPVFAGVSYNIVASRVGDKWVSRLMDGSLPVVVLTVEPASREGTMVEASALPPFFEHSEAVVRDESEIAPGLTITGRHSCDPVALEALGTRFSGISRHPWTSAVFACCSYLIGMELPGESALFYSLVLGFAGTLPRQPVALRYEASVQSVNHQIGLARIDISLFLDDRRIASGQAGSFIRPTLVAEPDSSVPIAASRDSLAGQTALVIGASRGLGAAMAHALEARGATVYALSRSATGHGTAHGTGRAESGDASDPDVLRRLRERILSEQGRLDILVCNACPPVLPLRLEPNSLLRIEAYVTLAVGLTAAPLCMFLDQLNLNDGAAVVISSAAVERPVRDWPHYMAAKQSVEMLARMASLQYPRVGTLIVRPPKLLTVLTNTPMGRRGASSPVEFASRIASRLEQKLEPGKTEVLG